MEIQQNTLYLTIPGLYISRDHLTLRIEQERELKLAVPIHHLESVCIFGQILLSPQALQLCFEHQVPVNYFSEFGYFLGRWEGIPKSSVLLRRHQYRAADDPQKPANIARQCVAGKIQNKRQNLLRSAREIQNAEGDLLKKCSEDLSGVLRRLSNAQSLDEIRGHEGQAAALYFSVFDQHLRHQREDFTFKIRSRRPPRDAINCLLSFLYALLTHDGIAALTVAGLDPYVGFLHTDRPNRPGLALDLIEEFRPLADRLAVTLINRKQISLGDFHFREGGAVELTDKGRKNLLTAYQTKKQETLTHPLLKQECKVGDLMRIQAKIMARHLREEIPDYLPFLVR